MFPAWYLLVLPGLLLLYVVLRWFDGRQRR